MFILSTSCQFDSFHTPSGKTMLYVQDHSDRHDNSPHGMVSNCVHFGAYMPDISRDIQLSSELGNVSLLTFMVY